MRSTRRKSGSLDLITCQQTKTHMWGKVDHAQPHLSCPSHHFLCFCNLANQNSQVFSQKGREGEKGEIPQVDDFIPLPWLWSPLSVCELFVSLCNSLINFPCRTSSSPTWWGTPIPLFIPWHCHTSLPIHTPTFSQHPFLPAFNQSFLSFLLFLLNFHGSPSLSSHSHDHYLQRCSGSTFPWFLPQFQI